MSSSVVRVSASVLACAVLAAGCAHAPKPEAPPPAAPAPAAPPPLQPSNTTPPQRQHYIIELLGAGKRDQARVEAQQLLKEQPANMEAQTFLNEIDIDPKTLLGAENFSYTVQPGETLTTLADRFLGDSNLFYALARYNNIDTPNDVAPGLQLLIPSTSRAVPVDHGDRVPRPEHGPHGERHEGEPALRKREETPAGAKKAPAEPPPAAAPAHDAARANTLRSEALVAMNKGSIDRAVALLRQAAALDPESQPISADLARALRIQGGAHK